MFDVGVYLASAPDSVDHPDGPLGHWLASGADDLPTPSGVPPVSWHSLRERVFGSVPNSPLA